MRDLLAQAQKMRERLIDAQRELAEAEIIGTSGGGLVTAVVSGTGELTGLTIDPGVVDPEDTETLADLVVAAVRDAGASVQRLAAEKLGPLGGDGPDLGGMLAGS
jgi:DNA-binding YbaB/EbfC family protein